MPLFLFLYIFTLKMPFKSVYSTDFQVIKVLILLLEFTVCSFGIQFRIINRYWAHLIASQNNIECFWRFKDKNWQHPLANIKIKGVYNSIKFQNGSRENQVSLTFGRQGSMLHTFKCFTLCKISLLKWLQINDQFLWSSNPRWPRRRALNSKWLP